MHAGLDIVRVGGIPWEDRVNVDGWPSRAGMYLEKPDLELAIRLVEYPFGSTEPRHVHGGRHATTVLEGRALVDSLTLGPLDVILGPSNEPHGPLDYPQGCTLVSAFQGSYFHSEVEHLSTEKNYRLVQAEAIPWLASRGDSVAAKTLVDHGAGPLLVEALRLEPGARFRPDFLAALVVAGDAAIGTEELGVWDLVAVRNGPVADSIESPNGTTLLAFTMR